MVTDSHGFNERATVQLHASRTDPATNCNGMLITSRIILTAAHCLQALSPNTATAELFYENIPGAPESKQFPIQPSPRPTFAPVSGVAYGDDVALLFIGPNDDPGLPFVDVPRELVETRVSRPAAARPSDPAGMAAWVGSPNRGSVLLPDLVASGNTWILGGGSPSTYPRVKSGDSGAPLFATGPNGVRTIFGVLAAHDNYYGFGEGHPIFADLTRSSVAAFIQSNALDTTRTSNWVAQHGGQKWIGEADYSGSCDTLNDRDCDGWRDSHDNCPDRFNPNQDDIDDDGIGDLCDNCVMAANPGQENCNLDFEDARNSIILGDACDPVPCPRTTAQQREVDGWTYQSACLDNPRGTRIVHDEMLITPVGPHRRDVLSMTPPPAIPLPDVLTTARYCNTVRKDDLVVKCNRPEVRNNAQLRKDKYSNDLTAVDPDNPWQRITLTAQRGASSPDRDSSGFLLTYADNVSKTMYWDFRADDAFWRRDGNDRLSSNIPGHSCTRTTHFGEGTCLDGWLWFHADTTVGSTPSEQDIKVNGVEVGFHDLELSNYTFPITPDRPFPTLGCIPIYPPCGPSDPGCMKGIDDLWLSLENCINCGGNLVPISKDRIRVPLINVVSTIYGPVWDDAVLRADDLGLSSAVVAALSNRPFVGSSACNAAPNGGIAAVSLPSSNAGGSTQYLVRSATDPAGFIVRDSTFNGSSTPPSTPVAEPMNTAYDLVDAKVVYAPARNGTFVLSGFKNGVLNRGVLFEPIDGELDILSSPNKIDAVVLAAQIAGNTLWTVERPASQATSQISQEVRLVRRNISSNWVSAPTSTATLTYSYSSVAHLATDFRRPAPGPARSC